LLLGSVVLSYKLWDVVHWGDAAVYMLASGGVAFYAAWYTVLDAASSTIAGAATCKLQFAASVHAISQCVCTASCGARDCNCSSQ
jgi:hypothetical protein